MTATLDSDDPIGGERTRATRPTPVLLADSEHAGGQQSGSLCAVSREIVATHSLDEAGRHPDLASGGATLRWMVLDMLEETARHAGHLDLIRELLDGRKGYY